MAATADLAGEDTPALFTVGKDGAVFYWMYDPAPPMSRPTPQGYAHVPGKHRKRKAPDTAPIQPTTAAAAANEAAAGEEEGPGEASEDGALHNSSDDSSSDDSSSGGSSNGSDKAETMKTGQSPGVGVSVESTEDGVDMLASTSGREDGEQHQQTLSFSGE